MGFEFTGAWLLWAGNLLEIKVSYLVLIHLLCSLLMAWILLYVLPHRYRLPQKSSIIFLCSIIFFIPLIGPLGLISSLLPTLIWPRSNQLSNATWQFATEPKLLENTIALSVNHPITESWIATVLQYHTSLDRRLTAVLATTKLPNKTAITLLRLALLDVEDDVRLLAYSLLDRKESSINHYISDQEQQLTHTTSHQQQALLHQDIAESCWDLVQLQLAQNEIEAHFLRKAIYHLNTALVLTPKNAGIYYLQGQIFLHQNKLKSATSAFSQAQKLGISYSQIAPYLAELNFKQRNFTHLSKHLVNLFSKSRPSPTISVFNTPDLTL